MTVRASPGGGSDDAIAEGFVALASGADLELDLLPSSSDLKPSEILEK